MLSLFHLFLWDSRFGLQSLNGLVRYDGLRYPKPAKVGNIRGHSENENFTASHSLKHFVQMSSLSWFLLLFLVSLSVSCFFDGS